MMKVNSQYSSEYLFNSLNFAPCSPCNDLADRCAARGGFKLESPDVGPTYCERVDFFVKYFHLSV